MFVRGHRTVGAACLGLAIVCLMNLTGCSERGEEERKTRKLEGIADRIDLENNRVSMRFIDKKGNERVIEGTFREDTIVLINDRQESLEHVKSGDKVVVFGHREGEGQNQQLIATKVIVTRPEGTDWKSRPEEKEEPKGESPDGAESSSEAANAG